MRLPAIALSALLISSAAIAQDMPKKSTFPVLAPNEIMACKIKCQTDRSLDLIVFPGVSALEKDYCGLQNFYFRFERYNPNVPNGENDEAYNIRIGASGSTSDVVLPIYIDEASKKPKYRPLIQSISARVVFECRVQTTPNFKWDIDKIYGQATGKVSDANVKDVAPGAAKKSSTGTATGSSSAVH